MQLKKLILTIGILALFIQGFGQINGIKLNKAFKANSHKMYKEFLDEWKSISKPISSLDSISEIEKDIYEIYTDFYNPFKLNRIGTGEWGDKLYAKVNYVVIQNSIDAYTYKTDSVEFNYWTKKEVLLQSKDSIIDFRPNISFRQAEVLYMTPKYDSLINRFLGNKHYALGTGGIMNPARAKGSSEMRVDFLNKYLKIIHGHWGGYWHIETHPYVFKIDFNKDRSIAKVHFRLVYQGGEADYYKENGKWILSKAYLTWIE